MGNQYCKNLWLLGVTLVLLAIPLESYGQKNQRKQTQIKAAFIFKMAKFVHWPFKHDQPITFCAFNNTQKFNVFTVLDNIKSQGKLNIQNTQVTLHVLEGKYDDLAIYQNCSLVYFDKKIESKIPSAVLKALSMRKLIIGNTKAFVEKGGLSALVAERGKSKLYINRLTYQQSKVKIRSRLMSLARMYPK